MHQSSVEACVYLASMSMANSLRTDPFDIHFMHDGDSVLLSFHRLDRIFCFCKQWMEFKILASLAFHRTYDIVNHHNPASRV